jgi:hypothetical protein
MGSAGSSFAGRGIASCIVSYVTLFDSCALRCCDKFWYAAVLRGRYRLNEDYIFPTSAYSKDAVRVGQRTRSERVRDAISSALDLMRPVILDFSWTVKRQQEHIAGIDLEETERFLLLLEHEREFLNGISRGVRASDVHVAARTTSGMLSQLYHVLGRAKRTISAGFFTVTYGRFTIAQEMALARNPFASTWMTSTFGNQDSHASGSLSNFLRGHNALRARLVYEQTWTFASPTLPDLKDFDSPADLCEFVFALGLLYVHGSSAVSGSAHAVVRSSIASVLTKHAAACALTTTWKASHAAMSLENAIQYARCVPTETVERVCGCLGHDYRLRPAGNGSTRTLGTLLTMLRGERERAAKKEQAQQEAFCAYQARLRREVVIDMSSTSTSKFMGQSAADAGSGIGFVLGAAGRVESKRGR